MFTICPELIEQSGMQFYMYMRILHLAFLFYLCKVKLPDRSYYSNNYNTVKLDENRYLYGKVRSKQNFHIN